MTNPHRAAPSTRRVPTPPRVVVFCLIGALALLPAGARAQQSVDMAKQVACANEHVPENLLNLPENIVGAFAVAVRSDLFQRRSRTGFNGTAEDAFKLLDRFRAKRRRGTTRGIFAPGIHRFQKRLTRTVAALQ